MASARHGEKRAFHALSHHLSNLCLLYRVEITFCNLHTLTLSSISKWNVKRFDVHTMVTWRPLNAIDHVDTMHDRGMNDAKGRSLDACAFRIVKKRPAWEQYISVSRHQSLPTPLVFFSSRGVPLACWEKRSWLVSSETSLMKASKFLIMSSIKLSHSWAAKALNNLRIAAHRKHAVIAAIRGFVALSLLFLSSSTSSSSSSPVVPAMSRQ